MNTSVKQKKELWPEFEAACRAQWESGGDRYALGDDKEFTDLVCEAAGNQWIGGNIVKYVGEIINTEPRPEVNFFKIATYAFIWWLKEQENLSTRDRGEEIKRPHEARRLAADCPVHVYYDAHCKRCIVGGTTKND